MAASPEQVLLVDDKTQWPAIRTWMAAHTDTWNELALQVDAPCRPDGLRALHLPIEAWPALHLRLRSYPEVFLVQVGHPRDVVDNLPTYRISSIEKRFAPLEPPPSVAPGGK